MELKVKNAAGEVRAIDIDAYNAAIIAGTDGFVISLLDSLTADECRQLYQWCDDQKPAPGGAIDISAWPGWNDTAAQRFQHFANKGRNYNLNIQTVTQSFVQLVVGAPASGKSVMMNTFPITDLTAPESKEGN
ncbi:MULTISPECIES: hypothetical protein [Burkholderiaceae]|uniref:Uncharacterized protein n=1 Tax=Paraburkholderia aromaticivorans TaxID=2026199 RepID=A0A248VZ87_9BURK|nr:MULTISPECIES: hypothetical protein [Burkholderiaceae]EIF28078.1 hypothetical protein BCh11DRAFT_07974 [Burkholderia sp. Ch1-1]HDR9770717.1 hypothetical protein [Burkholderia cepacia ATCC 25416]ASW04359.1 hypothetical protein CJU94_40175 [Paraburkholderia aromaticivorans]MCA8081664.1 hypothetical protein [Burkholderia cepacia]HDR9777978.1 hypothetical protein [Burkholderia cepacia ATCC 25416]